MYTVVGLSEAIIQLLVLGQELEIAPIRPMVPTSGDHSPNAVRFRAGQVSQWHVDTGFR